MENKRKKEKFVILTNFYITYLKEKKQNFYLYPILMNIFKMIFRNKITIIISIYLIY